MSTPTARDVPPDLQAFQRPRPAVDVPKIALRQKTVEPLIRVNVTPGGANSVKLEVRGLFSLVSLETKQTLAKDLSMGPIIVSASKSGLKLGSSHFDSARLEIVPETPSAVRVNGHLYRGRVRLYRRTDAQVSAVNVLPIEAYLASVVDAEMPAKFPDQARQAQAIVARTYALYQMQQADPNAVFDVFASQRSQKYLGLEYLDPTGRRLAGESESSRRLVEATRGVVCHRHGQLFCAYYSAVCGGETTNGQGVFKDAADVLTSVPCTWCHESPHYRWTKEIARSLFQQRAAKSDEQAAGSLAIRKVEQSAGPGGGVISQFEFSDGKQRWSWNGIELREKLPVGTVFSPHFRIRLEPEQVIIEGRGHGHGVGFCQWGAKGQAEAGHRCDEIVKYYYPGANLVTLNY